MRNYEDECKIDFDSLIVSRVHVGYWLKKNEMKLLETGL